MRKCRDHPDAPYRQRWNGGNVCYTCEECGSIFEYQRNLSFTGSRHLLAHLMMERTPVLKKYTFDIDFSEEDDMYVGLVKEFPSLSYLAEDSLEAMRGIINLTCETDADMKVALARFRNW